MSRLAFSSESYNNGLYALANTGGGYVAPAGKDPEADLTAWNGLIDAGEPYETPEDEAIAHQIYTYHQSYGTPLNGKPAPLFLESGWTDGLFPVGQSLRTYNQVRALRGYVVLRFGDGGHYSCRYRRPTSFGRALKLGTPSWLRSSSTKVRHPRTAAS